MKSIPPSKRPLHDALDRTRVLHRAGEDPFSVVSCLSDGVDEILAEIFAEKLGQHSSGLALLAVGGYGRRELCPLSDVDLLLVRRRQDLADEISSFVQALWDAGFEPGWAVRTLRECYHYMLDDHSTATATLESRLLCGSKELYEEFQVGCVSRFRRRHTESFARTKLRLLRESIEGEERTIYVIEPHLKEGPCGLRDVQRVLWVQNIRRLGGTLEALFNQRKFFSDEVSGVREAYAFYLRARCELHFSNRFRQDTLERDAQVQIARNLGLGENGDDRAAVEELMATYYRHARHVLHFLRFYLETGTRGRLFLARLSSKLLSSRVGPYLSAVRGRLVLAEEPPPADVPRLLTGVFEVAQRRGLRVGESLCEWIRRQVTTIEKDLSRSGTALKGLLSVLRDGRSVGRLLKAMHATGVLDRILPEFGAVNCLVSFDGHHQFTVDEHTLRTLEELDRVETEEDYPEPAIREVLGRIEDRLPLRLALLFHDIGKAVPGDHSVSSTDAAGLICGRLGVERKSQETVEFLVYRHLALYAVSQHRDLDDGTVIESFARLVETEARLNMLYVLTYLDICSVGPGTWTRWKGAQLHELYEHTVTHLRTGQLPEDRLEPSLAASPLTEDEADKVRDHCQRIGADSYVREIPERMLRHVQMVARARQTQETQVTYEDLGEYLEATFCGLDRAFLFADFAGVLLSEGLAVLGARLYSRDDGIALDVFQVEPTDRVRVSLEERVERTISKLRKVGSAEASIDDLVRARAQSFRMGKWRRPLFGAAVTIDNESSETETIVEVNAGDRPGLLYDLAVALRMLGLHVRMAKVSTVVERAHDVFYLTESDGTKLSGETRPAEVRKTLLAQAQLSADKSSWAG
jgi:[protein-PII] uridylyltransferase